MSCAQVSARATPCLHSAPPSQNPFPLSPIQMPLAGAHVKTANPCRPLVGLPCSRLPRASAVLSSKKLRVSLTCVPMKLMQRLALFALFWAQGEGFRRRARAVEKTGLRGPQEPKALLEELEEVLGAGHREAAERRLQGLEDDLRVTFKALPKNQRGALEAPSARYALHRLFNKRHGWQIKGLESAGGSWNVESPVLAMGDRVPPQMWGDLTGIASGPTA
ncbi:unnamed protein product [Durusdinium trenchii]|uniref:Uncharacterized protein n=1 Tax=Durusdinium trenchii TaxID=1381693 RepID=A0ABP0K6H1_9DINO